MKYWALDNEPMLWHATHRDVFPEPLGYDELWKRTVAYAEAIKAGDPTAKVAGFCSWGWTDLYYSAKDAGKDNYKTRTDWQAHDKVPLGEWFIKQCGDYKKKNGKPLIDVMDIHWYPQAQIKGKGAYLGQGLDAELNAYRMRSTRDLWDRKYEQESWIRNTDNYSPVALIPRVREWINKHNPGMEICLGEYNFGGGDNVTGGLAQCDVFGILAREAVDLAFIWYSPSGTQQLAWQLFRSYDGRGSGFGDKLLKAQSDNPNLSVYAARRTADNAVTVAVDQQESPRPVQLQSRRGAAQGRHARLAVRPGFGRERGGSGRIGPAGRRPDRVEPAGRQRQHDRHHAGRRESGAVVGPVFNRPASWDDLKSRPYEEAPPRTPSLGWQYNCRPIVQAGLPIRRPSRHPPIVQIAAAAAAIRRGPTQASSQRLPKMVKIGILSRLHPFPQWSNEVWPNRNAYLKKANHGKRPASSKARRLKRAKVRT